MDSNSDFALDGIGEDDNYVPLDKQIEVLESLGIERPTEAQIQDYREMVKENSYARVYLEGFPYQMILSNLGFGEYDGETYEQILKSQTVYSFDFEGWDISQDYIDVLNGIQFIANEEFQLQDIREDCSQVNWAKEFEEKTGLELETGWEVGKGEMSI